MVQKLTLLSPRIHSDTFAASAYAVMRYYLFNKFSSLVRVAVQYNIINTIIVTIIFIFRPRWSAGATWEANERAEGEKNTSGIARRLPGREEKKS